MTTTTMREKYEAKRKARFMGQCVHYLSPHDSQYCAAGIDLATVTDYNQAPYRRICTCPETPIPCEKRELPTEADWEDCQRSDLESLARMAWVRRAILATGETQGGLDCPCCDGRVGFTNATNGHVAASCSTPGCAKWME